jgi:hypothetical protein
MVIRSAGLHAVPGNGLTLARARVRAFSGVELTPPGCVSPHPPEPLRILMQKKENFMLGAYAGASYRDLEIADPYYGTPVCYQILDRCTRQAGLRGFAGQNLDSLGTCLQDVPRDVQV